MLFTSCVLVGCMCKVDGKLQLSVLFHSVCSKDWPQVLRVEERTFACWAISPPQHLGLYWGMVNKALCSLLSHMHQKVTSLFLWSNSCPSYLETSKSPKIFDITSTTTPSSLGSKRKHKTRNRANSCESWCLKFFFLPVTCFPFQIMTHNSLW